MQLKIRLECDCENCKGNDPCWVYEEYEDELGIERFTLSAIGSMDDIPIGGEP
tara:strand:- start:5384 stop:5542 length:159 start_codon:yes stop_codon:yes gene_type:complete